MPKLRRKGVQCETTHLEEGVGTEEKHERRRLTVVNQVITNNFERCPTQELPTMAEGRGLPTRKTE